MRFNNYVRASLAVGLFGAQGIALAAVCVAAIVPAVNLMCVLVFVRTLRIDAAWNRRARAPDRVESAGGCVRNRHRDAGRRRDVPARDRTGRARTRRRVDAGRAALTFDATRAWTQPLCVASAFKRDTHAGATAPFTWQAAGAIAYLGAVGTVVAFVWYSQGIRALGPARTAVFTILVPVFGVLLSVVLLGESLTRSMLAGGVLVIAGVMLTNRIGR